MILLAGLMESNPINFSMREINVLALLARGKSNREIDAALNSEERTAECCVFHIMRKTGVHNRVLLAFYAYGRGYVTNVEIKNAIHIERKEHGRRRRSVH